MGLRTKQDVCDWLELTKQNRKKLSVLTPLVAILTEERKFFQFLGGLRLEEG